MYQSLGKPRRVFGSLIKLVFNRRLQGNQAAAHAALAEARSLIQPDWPAEFHIRLRCRERELVHDAGRLSDALVINREEVRLSTATGDWHLEVFARTNLIHWLWEVGPIEEASRSAAAERSCECDRRRRRTELDVRQSVRQSVRDGFSR